MKTEQLTQKTIVTVLATAFCGVSAGQVLAAPITDGQIDSIAGRLTQDVHYAATDITVGSANQQTAVNLSGGGASVYLGGSQTQSVSIHAKNYGLVVVEENGKKPHVVINAKDKISIDSKYVGLQTQSNTELKPSPADATSVQIQAPIVDIQTDNVAVLAFSNSRVAIEGDDITIVRRKPQSNGFKGVMQIRGNSVVTINADKKGSVVLDGDIMFTTPAPVGPNGSLINGDVTLNLTGPESLWTGCAIKSTAALGVDTGFETFPTYGPVTDFKILVADGAKWEMNNSSYASHVTVENGGIINVQEKAKTANFEALTLANGVINLQGDATQKLESRITHGTGTVNLKAVKSGDTLTAPSLKMIGGAHGANVNVKLVGASADDFKDPAKALASLEDNIDMTQMDGTLTLSGNDLRGDYTQALKSDGTKGTIVVHKNPKLDAYSSIYSLGAVQWRHESDSLFKRMGDLRDAEGHVGLWARLYGSEQEYGDQKVKAKNTTVQVGGDVEVGAGWKVGSAFSYTEGDTDYSAGSGDSDMYGLAVYGTWLAESGTFVDVIGKYARLSNDFKAGNMQGQYRNNAWSVSGELGHRFNFNNVAFLEPAVGLTYGQILGEDFTASNDVRVSQDNYESLVARAGVRTGWYLPKAMGSVHARVAVLHDFLGDAESTAQKVNAYGDLLRESMKDELGGTWVEYAVGANLRLSDTAYSYVDVERTSGSEIVENWKFTVGLRKVF